MQHRTSDCDGLPASLKTARKIRWQLGFRNRLYIPMFRPCSLQMPSHGSQGGEQASTGPTGQQLAEHAPFLTHRALKFASTQNKLGCARLAGHALRAPRLPAPVQGAADCVHGARTSPTHTDCVHAFHQPQTVCTERSFQPSTNSRRLKLAGEPATSP